MWWSTDRDNKHKSKRGAATFLARFGSGLGLALGLGVGSTLVLRSHQEVRASSQTRTAHRPRDPGDQIAREAPILRLAD